jgi:flagellar basal body rod protein FlgB
MGCTNLQQPHISPTTEEELPATDGTADEGSEKNSQAIGNIGVVASNEKDVVLFEGGGGGGGGGGEKLYSRAKESSNDECVEEVDEVRQGSNESVDKFQENSATQHIHNHHSNKVSSRQNVDNIQHTKSRENLDTNNVAIENDDEECDSLSLGIKYETASNGYVSPSSKSYLNSNAVAHFPYPPQAKHQSTVLTFNNSPPTSTSKQPVHVKAANGSKIGSKVKSKVESRRNKGKTGGGGGGGNHHQQQHAPAAEVISQRIVVVSSPMDLPRPPPPKPHLRPNTPQLQQPPSHKLRPNTPSPSLSKNFHPIL